MCVVASGRFCLVVGGCSSYLPLCVALHDCGCLSILSAVCHLICLLHAWSIGCCVLSVIVVIVCVEDACSSVLLLLSLGDSVSS